MTQRIIYVNGSAADGGNGSKSTPYNDLDWAFTGADEFIVELEGTITATAPWEPPSRTKIRSAKGKPRAVINGGDGDMYGLIRLQDAFDVEIEDVILERAFHGFVCFGSARNVVLRNVEARDIWGYGGFAHEDATTGIGRINYFDCVARRCEGDGFSNRGAAKDRFIRCQAIECGPKWGTYVLSDRVPDAEVDPRTYSTVTVGGPTLTGRVVYLDTVNGSDSNDGFSPSTAWATVSKLNSSSLAGDEIVIMRGSATSTGQTITAKANQKYRPGGEGRRPYLNNFASGQASFEIDGVSNVWIEGMYFKDGSPGIEIQNAADDIWIVDCRFTQCDTHAIEILSAAGTVNIFGCDSFFNTRGFLNAASGTAHVNAWKCSGDRNGFGYDSVSAGAWRIAGSCTATLREVYETRPRYRGFAIESDTGTTTLDGCWVKDPEAITAIAYQKGIDKVGAAHLEVRNTTFTMIDPDSGKTSVGAYVMSGTATFYHNTFQDSRNTGGDGSSMLLITDSAGLVTWKNNIFDSVNANTTSSSYYVTLDADAAAGAYVASNNWYRGEASKLLWRDSGATAADMNVVTFVGIAGIDDEGTGEMLDVALTQTNPAVNGPWEARAEDGPTTMHFQGLDLSASSDAVTWTTDAGHRTRGRQGLNATAGEGWMPGAWENITGSPDGFTTHPHTDTVQGSSMLLEDCGIFTCMNGCDFTHDQATAETDMGVHRTVFVDCYDGGFETLFGRPFPIRDCHFIGGVGNAIDINPTSAGDGDTWLFEGCVFDRVAGDSMVSIRSQTNTTANFASCIFIGPETGWSPQPAVTNQSLITYGDGAVTTTIQNCAFWMPVARNGTAKQVAIEMQAIADGTLNVYNCMFFAPDESVTTGKQWIDSAAARLGTLDNNFYYLHSTNTANWDIAGDRDFTYWQGTSSQDANGWESAYKIANLPPVGDERSIPPMRFALDPFTEQATGGSDQSAISRRAFGGKIRTDAGNWGIGPIMVEGQVDSVLRGANFLSFDSFVLDANVSKNIELEFGARFSRGERHGLTGGFLQLSTGTAVAFKIHTGVYGSPDSKVIVGGVVPASGTPIPFGAMEGPQGEPLRISFIGTSGTVHGTVGFKRGK